ncbi:MAG: hypothetical protein ACYDCL_20730 [Myxococcales bacterium]
MRKLQLFFAAAAVLTVARCSCDTGATGLDAGGGSSSGGTAGGCASGNQCYTGTCPAGFNCDSSSFCCVPESGSGGTLVGACLNGGTCPAGSTCEAQLCILASGASSGGGGSGTIVGSCQGGASCPQAAVCIDSLCIEYGGGGSGGGLGGGTVFGTCPTGTGCPSGTVCVNELCVGGANGGGSSGGGVVIGTCTDGRTCPTDSTCQGQLCVSGGSSGGSGGSNGGVVVGVCNGGACPQGSSCVNGLCYENGSGGGNGSSGSGSGNGSAGNGSGGSNGSAGNNGSGGSSGSAGNNGSSSGGSNGGSTGGGACGAGAGSVSPGGSCRPCHQPGDCISGYFCSSTSDTCGQPTVGEPCTPQVGCNGNGAANVNCVNVAPSGSSYYLCEQNCTQDSDCSSLVEICTQSPIAGGGMSCNANLCNAPYQRCNAAGSNDGTCLPSPQLAGTGFQGICLQGGNDSTGSQCDGERGGSHGLCTTLAACMGAVDAGNNTACEQICNISGSPSCGSGYFCYPAENNPGWGYCIEPCNPDGGYYDNGVWDPFSQCVGNGSCQQAPGNSTWGCFP